MHRHANKQTVCIRAISTRNTSTNGQDSARPGQLEVNGDGRTCVSAAGLPVELVTQAKLSMLSKEVCCYSVPFMNVNCRYT